jgi:hypothetical protein
MSTALCGRWKTNSPADTAEAFPSMTAALKSSREQAHATSYNRDIYGFTDFSGAPGHTLYKCHPAQCCLAKFPLLLSLLITWQTQGDRALNSLCHYR